MKRNWNIFLNKATKIIEKENETSDVLFFRGHSNFNWELKPSLYRLRNTSQSIKRLETNIYYDFVTNAGPLLGTTRKKSWEILFLMQHFGLPTRLLDWTENFATALFFAINDSSVDKPAIWILNPYKLNSKTEEIGKVIINPDLDFDFDYYRYFLDLEKIKQYENPIAIYPIRENTRLFNQKGLFTLHSQNLDSLEKIAPECLHKIEIPIECINEANKFLELAGVNYYTIFNDLESLSKHLKKRLI